MTSDKVAWVAYCCFAACRVSVRGYAYASFSEVDGADERGHLVTGQRGAARCHAGPRTAVTLSAVAETRPASSAARP